MKFYHFGASYSEELVKAALDENLTTSIPSIAKTGPVSFAVFRLARVHRALAAKLLRKAGLHPGQEIVMMHLLDQDGLIQSDLIKLVGFDASTATKMLQRLEKEGFLERRQSKEDKRAITVHLTSQGKKLKFTLTEIWKEIESRTIPNLSKNQRAEAVEILNSIVQSVTQADLADEE